MDTHETKVYIAVLIAAGILAVFLIYFIGTIIGHQRRHQALQNERLNAEITTLEHERTRMASDLHDDLGPMLSSVKLLINNLAVPSATDRADLARANSYIDGILVQLHRISNDLMPLALTRNGLVAAINEYVSELNDRRAMQIRFRPGTLLQLPAEGSIHLYRIMHEIIHNADKHARASELEIYLNQMADKFVLVMRDNGCGFNPKDTGTTQKGHGLRNITSRVEALHGNIYLASAPGSGTEYTIEIPTTIVNDA